MTNKDIAKLLRNVSAAFSIKDDKKYRFQFLAYEKAADTIENATSQVEDLIKEDKIDSLPGIGTTIKQRLDELIKTGHVKHFETVLTDIPPAVFPLLDIPTFGPKKAYKLVTAFKLKDPKTAIADVETQAKAGKISKLESFGEKSEQDILRAISEFREGYGKTTRMLLPFATELAEKLVAYLKQSPDIKDAQPLGSLRRKVTTIGDIDIAVSTNNPDKAIEHFINYPYKERIIEQGSISASILTSGGQQIDLMTQPVESFGSLLQHFTGSKRHNVHLRDYSLRKGLSLSEKGIKHLTGKDKDKMFSYVTEESFYNAIGLDWIPPEMREDTGEIELAVKHELPKIVELEDIKGDFHIHSNYPIEPSHDLGDDDMQTMLDKANELHYEYLAFSEHNPSVSKHTKEQIHKLLEKRFEKIEQLQMKNKSIRIIKLLEVDILTDGQLAINSVDFKYLDAVIVSIHSSFGMDEEQMTKRVLNGLSHPKAKILAHPTGRMLNQRPGYTLNWGKIFNYCNENNKALEINSWPERLDLPDNLIRQAVDNSVKLVIDTDSHAVEHMNLMRYGVSLARRGWAKPSDIINTWEYNKVIEWLHK